MRSFRSAVDFARSSSRECLRRCQKHGLFLTVGNVGDSQVCGAADQQQTDQEILEYRLFREFCEPAMENGNSSCPLDSRNGNHGDTVRLRRSDRSVSCSDSLQQAHTRLHTVASTTDATAVSGGSYAPSVKTRSQRVASSIGRLSRKLQQCEVVLLDGSGATFSVDPSSRAQTLLDLTCEFLSITERQYFGLCYKDAATGTFEWLYNEKRLGKQLDAAAPTWRLDFAVKFYPSRPECLADASARNCLALQIRQCLVAGRLPCSVVGYALLGSYLMQSVLGDRRKIGDNGGESAAVEDDPPAFCPPELLVAQPGVARMARRLHACHAGLASRDAERHLLANARRLAAYGLDVHEATCVEGGGEQREVGEGENDVLVGVCSDGLVLMRPDGLLRLARLTWPRITALTRRGREVRVALRRWQTTSASATSATAQATATVRLRCESGRLSKRLWRSAVEHHGFFRLRSRDNSARKRIQSSTVRLSRSCYNSNGLGGQQFDQLLTAEDGGSTNLQRSLSMPWQRRAVSLNRVSDTRARPATLVTPEDADDSGCQAAAAATTENILDDNTNDEDDDDLHEAEAVDVDLDDAPNETGMALRDSAAESQAEWQPEEDDGFMEPSILDRAATLDSATNSTMNRRFQFYSNSSAASRYDSSSTDFNQEHEPRTASEVAWGSPVSRQPPSGEETPSGQPDCYDDKRSFFRNSDAESSQRQREITVPVPPSVDQQSLPSPAEPRNRRSTGAVSASSAAPATEVDDDGEEANRGSIMETRTETTEINEPIEELFSYTDEHGNSVTRKVYRCRRIRRIVTDTLVESPLSAWHLYCQDNLVDEATMAAVMEQLQLKRVQQQPASRSGRDEGYV